MRLISLILPDDFPYHRNGKMSECHIAFWRDTASCDHVVPVAPGMHVRSGQPCHYLLYVQLDRAEFAHWGTRVEPSPDSRFRLGWTHLLLPRVDGTRAWGNRASLPQLGTRAHSSRSKAHL